MSKNAAEQYCLFSRASFIHTIQCVFYCRMPLPEAELMIGYFQPLGGALLRGPLDTVDKKLVGG
jgi:hypothetical protein